ncbi:MAG: hypothetical protein HY372_00270 [Candidatus Andersenbacteria bacterium]|nr:hypothetical protein [Candidatus Andersenbacteria bacterium]
MTMQMDGFARLWSVLLLVNTLSFLALFVMWLADDRGLRSSLWWPTVVCGAAFVVLAGRYAFRRRAE